VIDDVEFICRSLGFIVSKNQNTLSLMGNLNTIPTRLKRLVSSVISYYDTIQSITYIGKQNYTGILVNSVTNEVNNENEINESNHRFLLSNFMVTHNSHIIRHTVKPYADLHGIDIGIT